MRVTRRDALVGGIASAAGAAGLAHVLTTTSGGEGASEAAPDDSPRAAAGAARQPVIYIPHGGGPWPFVELGFGTRAELDALADYLRGLTHRLPSRPRALLVVSAHWEESVPTVMTHARPPMLYDYYGFPPESYRITWPAPGDPALAARVRGLVEQAGFQSAADPARGFDHGTFVPLKLSFPDADVPTVQLSLVRGLDPATHLALGRALAPLRDEGVLIVASGMTYHDLRGFGRSDIGPISETFDAWLRESAVLEREARDARLVAWAQAPAARRAHPREEHLLPLMVAAGAAGEDRATVPYNGTFAGARLSAYHFG
jgi:aromatic ring-opening dioxygenase catalytic subunit (LigB family)